MPGPDRSTSPNHDRRWLILGVIGIAQLMVVLDVTIVNIALPSAQAELGFSDDKRQWVITAYALAFGSLLLLGGRIADLFGRKWTFVVGLLGFAGASALGGAAQSFGLLVGARALQGVFGAVLAPAALSILATTFTDPAERGKAFGIYSAIAGMGGAVGLLLGGVLTELLDWRWCLYVSIAFAVPAAIGGTRLMQHVRTPGPPRLDLPGTAMASGGLFALVFGLSRAASDGWGEPITIGFLGASGVLLLGFIARQLATANARAPVADYPSSERPKDFFETKRAFNARCGCCCLGWATWASCRRLNPVPAAGRTANRRRGRACRAGAARTRGCWTGRRRSAGVVAQMDRLHPW